MPDYQNLSRSAGAIKALLLDRTLAMNISSPGEASVECCPNAPIKTAEREISVDLRKQIAVPPDQPLLSPRAPKRRAREGVIGVIQR